MRSTDHTVARYVVISPSSVNSSLLVPSIFLDDMGLILLKSQDLTSLDEICEDVQRCDRV